MKQNITLISDWRIKDPYLSLFKNQLNQEIPDNLTYDISHGIAFGMISQAAFILKNSYSQFPEKSIHIILVANSFNSAKTPILVEYDNHYFLGEDTGIFSLIVKNAPYKAYKFRFLPKEKDFLSNLILMAKWASNEDLNNNVVEYNEMKNQHSEEYSYYKSDHTISGKIVYIDAYHNAITNIPADIFRDLTKNKTFKATIGEFDQIVVHRFHEYYNAQEPEIYLVANRMGYLEITMYNGNVSILANLQLNDKINITIN